VSQTVPQHRSPSHLGNDHRRTVRYGNCKRESRSDGRPRGSTSTRVFCASSGRLVRYSLWQKSRKWENVEMKSQKQVVQLVRAHQTPQPNPLKLDPRFPFFHFSITVLFFTTCFKWRMSWFAVASQGSLRCLREAPRHIYINPMVRVSPGELVFLAKFVLQVFKKSRMTYIGQ